MLSRRPAMIVSIALVIAAAALFLWLAVSAGSDPGSPLEAPAQRAPPRSPQGEATPEAATPGDSTGPKSRGATPEGTTPTLGPPQDSTLAAAMARIRQAGAGTVLDRALAGDVDGLLDLIEWERRPCNAPEVVWHRCAEAGVAPGTPVPVIQLDDLIIGRYYDRTFVAAHLETLLGARDADLVFAGRTSAHIGLGFSLPSPRARPIGGGSPLQGLWFDVRPGSPPVIEHVHFFTQFYGSRQQFQTYYQPEGGELWYFDRDKAHASAPVPTPDAPPPVR